MNERENESFEAELRRLRPANLPDEFESCLSPPPPIASPHLAPEPRSRRLSLGASSWLRWLAPAAALALVWPLVLTQLKRGTQSPPATAVPAPTLKADEVEIDRQLLDSFDAVANLPDGEPVRFRLQQWMDAVTLRDSVSGIEVVRRIPRIEFVPVSFATY